MPLDEQDAKFEKALSRHLRAECPEVETLAAYHERTLAPEELIQWKKHIVGCGSCQEILAELEQTEGIPLEEGSDVAPVQAGVVAEAPGRVRDLQAASAVTRTRTPAKKLTQMPKRAPWRWAAPAGAIAAGLLVWLAVKDQNRAVLVPKNEPQLVADQKTRAATPESEVAQMTSPSSGVLRRSQPLPKASPPRDQAAAQELLKRERELLKSQEEASAGRGERGKQNQPMAPSVAKERDDATAKLQGKSEAAKDLDGNVVPPVAQSSVDVSAAPAPVAAPPSEDKNALAMSESVASKKPTPSRTTDEAKKKADIGMLRQQNANAGNMVGGYKQEAYLADEVSALHTVRSADGKTFWTVGPGGRIERAGADARQWSTQESGVEADLTAGSAPTEKICWVVGRAGTILRTTDGGEHWEKIASPLEVDWGSVRATDAKHAVISSVTTAVTYETVDGGIVWKRVTNP